jgi:hypothetical protein
MSIVQVGLEWTQNTTTSVPSQALPVHTVAAGDDVVIWVSGRAATPPTSITPTDTGGSGGANSWTQVGGVTQGALRLECWRSTIAHGGALTILLTPNTGASLAIEATEQNGMMPIGTSLKDFITFGQSATGSALDTGTTAATALAGELISAASASGQATTSFMSQTFTPSTSPTLGTIINSTPGNSLQAGWEVSGGTGTQRFQSTATVAGVWIAGIATFKPASVAAKAVPHGFWNRSGIGDIPGTGPNGAPTGAGYRSALCGCVITGAVKGGVTWNQLQGTQAANNAGTIDGHAAGFTGTNPIDKAILDVRAWNTNSGIWAGFNSALLQQCLKLRLMTGVDSPNWSLSLGGGPLANFSDPNGGGTYNLPYFWSWAYISAALSFFTAAGHIYDGVPEIQLIVASTQMTVGNEPCLHQTAAGPTQLAAMIAAGYRDDVSTTIAAGSNGAVLPQAIISLASTTGLPSKGVAFVVIAGVSNAIAYTGIAGSTITGCSGGVGTLATGQTVDVGNVPEMEWEFLQLAARFPTTTVSYASNPYQQVQGTNHGGTESIDTAIRAAGRTALGTDLSLENNSWRQAYMSGNGPYQQMYADISARGGPICFQTSTLIKIGDLATAIQGAGALGANSLELPDGYDGYFGVAPGGATALAALLSDLPTFGGGSTIPSPPSGVMAVQASSTSATVSWTPNGNGGSALTSYTITPYIGATPQTPVTGISPAATSSTVTGLTTGFTYTFVVQAVNTNGASTLTVYPGSDASAPITLSAGGTTVPATPAAPVMAPVGSGSVSATITPPNNGGVAIDSYIVTPYIGGVAQPTQTFAGTPAPTLDTLIGLLNGTAYTFTVIAHNANGNSGESPQSLSITPVNPNATATTSVISGATPFWQLP